MQCKVPESPRCARQVCPRPQHEEQHGPDEEERDAKRLGEPLLRACLLAVFERRAAWLPPPPVSLSAGLLPPWPWKARRHKHAVPTGCPISTTTGGAAPRAVNFLIIILILSSAPLLFVQHRCRHR